MKFWKILFKKFLFVFVHYGSKIKNMGIKVLQGYINHQKWLLRPNSGHFGHLWAWNQPKIEFFAHDMTSKPVRHKFIPFKNSYRNNFPIFSTKIWKNKSNGVRTKDMSSLVHWPRYLNITCSFVLLLLKCSSVSQTLLFQTLSYVNFCQNQQFCTISTRVWSCDGPMNWWMDKASF